MGLTVSAFGGYDYTISSGYFYDITLENNQSLLMTGGGGLEITAKDFSVLDIRDTSVYVPLSGGIGSLIVFDYSQLLFSGGHVNRLDIGERATAILSGGQIHQITSGYSYADPLHIKIICQTAVYDPTTKYLNGTWKDGTDFSILFKDRDGYSSVIDNVTIIPEPATMLLLGLGGILLRRRQ
jgi:hypothetical protein